MELQADPDYAVWKVEDSLEVRVHLDVIDGIRRDLFEHADGQVAGLLLGHREGEAVWIERYRRDDSGEAPGAVGSYAGSSKAFEAPAGTDGLFLVIQPDESGLLAARVRGQVFPFHARTRGRRLVPDFDRPVEAVAAPQAAAFPNHAQAQSPETPSRRWWVWSLGAMGLAGLALWGIPQMQQISAVPPGAERPLGLHVDTHVDTTGDAWRVSWNRDATGLAGAKSVRLFVRDGEEPSQADLTARDLQAGIREWPKPAARDVTFRMEAVGRDGRIRAESFRILREAPAVPVPPAATASAPTATAPSPTKKVAPVVAASIRPRIRGKVAIDVRVSIDEQGRVSDAEPRGKARKGVEAYLAKRATEAAMGWKFAPATRNGVAVPGNSTLHFVFTR